ncbi:helix-turn-helix domain-containing protein [Streptosporangiaceae bacterium NEAU-GS5]|nr:helix-turn-helix domain-containing protein [Streptosporangiaceae bacterium NEAU-GS5]
MPFDDDGPGAEIQVAPAKSGGFPPAQPAQGDQPPQRIQPILAYALEEGGQVLGRPDRDGRALARRLPFGDSAVEEVDRVYAMNLAMIRKAGQMTQVEVAKKLGVGQGVISRLENRTDMLLSTLYDYLVATGAENAGIVVTVHGRRIELDLAQLRQPE